MANINVNISGTTFNQPAFKLIDGLTIEKVKIKYNWLLNAIVENALIGEDSYGLVWYQGNWISGTWYDGTWYSGNFLNGRWKNGNFYSYNVTFNFKYDTVTIKNDNSNYHSYFANGTWYFGKFYSGTFGLFTNINDISLDYKININDIYNNFSTTNIINLNTTGNTNTTSYVNSLSTLSLTSGYSFVDNLNNQLQVPLFLSGFCYNGLFINSVWKNGTFYNGIMYNCMWINGSFYNGIFADKYWFNGNFFGGDFSTGTWFNGTFSKKNKLIDSNFGRDLQNEPYYKAYYDTGTTLTTDWYYPTIINPNTTDLSYTSWSNIETDSLFLSSKCLLNNTANNKNTYTLDLTNFINTTTNNVIFDELSINCKIVSFEIDISKKSNQNNNITDSLLSVNDINFDVSNTGTCFVQFTNKIYKLNTTAITYSDIQNLVVKYQLYSNTTDTLSLNYVRIRINYNKYYPENVISIWSGGTWENGNFYAGQETDVTKIINNSSLWYTGLWNNGNFYGGKISSINWIRGNFYYGIFGNNKDNAIWNNGYFYNGVFTGIFYNGTFYNGIVLNSNMLGGTFSG